MTDKVTAIEAHTPDFMEIGTAILQMLARTRHIDLKSSEARHALIAMRRLPPHPDVLPALSRLRQAGYRLATLSNSSEEGLEAQLDYAFLPEFFERRLSVETPQLYKPHRDVYVWAAQQMSIVPSEGMLVAAHGWDVAGAKWAGWHTAFIARAGQQIFPLAEHPDIDVAAFAALADALGA